jgi:hypothetical protein
MSILTIVFTAEVEVKPSNTEVHVAVMLYFIFFNPFTETYRTVYYGA